ncbi:MAG: VOC family protein [Pseudomonadota bacterium]
MPLRTVYAHLSCADIEVSTRWFEALFGRAADATPMEGLTEWHHGREAGFQLFENPKDAGHGCVTLIVSDLDGERARLARVGLGPPEVMSASTTRLLQLRDPDGNLVVLAEPLGDPGPL